MDTEDLENRFTYHAPMNSTTRTAYHNIRGNARMLALLLNEECPDSRELSLAITHLEEMVFWANAAIARHGLPSKEV
jgi:hypothetical protein